MTLWFSLLIPIATIVFLLINHRKELVGWELIILIGIPTIFVFGVSQLGEYTQTKDTEYWGGWVTESRHYEDWNEYIHKTCTDTDCDSEGNCTTRTYDCSYVDYHPEYWEIRGSNGEQIGISQQRFNLLCQQFENKTFVDLNRSYYTNDGDMYITKYFNQEDKIEPITTIHSWKNRVQASRSIFKFPEVMDKSGLYDYPTIIEGYKQPVVLGPISSTQTAGVKKMEYVNATLGAKKKVRIYTLLYKNLPMEKAIDQQSLWMGGNKNELNIAVGLNNDEEVQWVYVFSWSEIENLKIDVKNFIIAQPIFNLVELADWIGPEMEKRWVKKNFHDFDYLTVDTPTWAIVVAYILALLLSIGIGIYITNNEERG